MLEKVDLDDPGRCVSLTWNSMILTFVELIFGQRGASLTPQVCLALQVSFLGHHHAGPYMTNPSIALYRELSRKIRLLPRYGNKDACPRYQHENGTTCECL